MGLAKIISGGPTGLYNIELVRDISKITSEIAAITSRLSVLDKGIADALQAKNKAEGDLNDKLGVLDTAINGLILKTVTEADISKAQSEYLSALKVYQEKSVAYSLLLQEQESKTKRKALLQAAAVTENRNGVWCADLTEDLPAGEEVATIEVNGDAVIAPIIYPGGDYDNLVESKLQPTQASTPSGVFYNLAILAAWQRWKPTYRVGTITAIAGDLCTVRLDTARSKAQKLNINPLALGGAALVLLRVPIEYMDGLNGSAFVTGDRVVVEFGDQSWSKPKVIGFESHPRSVPVKSQSGNYYIFYNSGGALKVARCDYEQEIEVRETKNWGEILPANILDTVTYHCKRFSHNVDGTVRDLYFIATSLSVPESPFSGWSNFVAANPDFALVTNHADSQITMTPELMAHLGAVNLAVNSGHLYVSEGTNNNWRIMGSGETGDCEDFALTKAKALLDMGYPASALHIEAALIEGGTGGHAWLVVQTTDGDYALDLNSNAVVKNYSLKFGTSQFYARCRQIGKKWASISPFGWLLSAQNYPGYAFCYILDPELNLLHSLGASLGMPFQYINSASVNFSADDNSIYFANSGVIREYRLSENILEEVSSKTNSGLFVTRAGVGAVDPWSSGGKSSDQWEVTSPDGYYDHRFYCSNYDSGNTQIFEGEGYYGNDFPLYPVAGQIAESSATTHNWIIGNQGSCFDRLSYAHSIFTAILYGDIITWTSTLGTNEYLTNIIKTVRYFSYIVMGKRFDDSFYEYADAIAGIFYYKTPWGNIPYAPSPELIWPGEMDQQYNPGNSFTADAVSQIDTDDLLIQSFSMKRRLTDVGDNLIRVYKNGVPCQDAVTAAVGVAGSAILSLIYMPAADRLNV